MTQRESIILLRRIQLTLVFIWNRRLLVIGISCAVLYAGYVLFLDRVVFFDEQEYLTIANNLLRTGVYGLSPGVPSAARAPGYILFITPIVALGLGKSGVVFVQVLLWGGSVYLAGVIGYGLRRKEAAGLAILLAIFYPLSSAVALTVYPQILTAFFVLLFVWIIFKQGSLAFFDTRTAVLAGITMGLSVLVTPILLLILSGFLFVLAGFFWSRFRGTIVAVLVCCSVITPWIGRNLIVLRTPSISTIVGFNLIYANSENASPELGTAVNIDKYSDAVRGMNEVETDRAFRDFALNWMYHNPGAAIRLYIGKFIQFFGYREVIKTPVGGVKIFQTVVALAYYPLLVVSFIGVIFLVINRGTSQIKGDIRNKEIMLASLYLIAAGVHAIFLQRLRYRVEVDFLVIVLAADFLSSIFTARPLEARRETDGELSWPTDDFSAV
jgi:hypothetical protein